MTAAALPLASQTRIAHLPSDLRRALESSYGHTAGPVLPRSAPADKWALVDRWHRSAKADGELCRALAELRAPAWTMGTSDSEITHRAKCAAAVCERFGGQDRRRLSPYLDRSIFAAGITDEQLARRIGSWRFWRQSLRRHFAGTIEQGLRARGLVRKGRAVYASDWATQRDRAARRRNRALLESSLAVSNQGDQLPLLELADASMANPAIRRGELMTRSRGLEEIARELGDAAVFVTMTCPSRFHAQLSSGGENPAYDGSSVRDAQAWLCRMWARSRAKAKRLSMLVYGVRVAEPHHDGTPHWHALLYCSPREVDLLERVIRGHWLSEDADEPGAREHRVKFKRIDLHERDHSGELKRSPATGYLAKYVAKNIDGFGVGQDLEADAPIDHTVDRVTAWAHTHRIRQFQQLGGAPVGLWRELRRIREPVESPAIEAARLAADEGDYRAFIHALGGVAVGRRTSVTLAKSAPHEPFNRYGEQRPDIVVGIQCGLEFIRTRSKRWRVIFGGWTGGAASSAPLGPVSITVRGREEKLPRAGISGAAPPTRGP